MISISVIVPVYGVENSVGQCVKSVMAQVDGLCRDGWTSDSDGESIDVECVIVDDCSPDGSMKVVDGLLADYAGSVRFKVIRHDRNMELSEARNTGISAADGDYLLFLDSDDELTSGALRLMAAQVKAHPDVDMVVGDYDIKGDDDLTCDYSGYHININDSYVAGQAKCKRIFLKERLFPDTAHNKLVRREFVTDNDLFFRPGIYHEDNLWKWHCAKHICSVAFVKHPTMVYNIRPGSISNLHITKRMDSMFKILEEKIVTLDDTERRAQIRNAVLFLHQLDWRSRSGLGGNDRCMARQCVRKFAARLRNEALTAVSARSLLSLLLLEAKLRLPLSDDSRAFWLMHAAARRLVN